MLALLLAQSLVLQAGDFNEDLGVDAHYFYRTNHAASSVLPFDANAGHWDFSSFNTGGDARVQLVAPGGTPYAGSFPQATSCAIQDIPGTDRAYFYQHVGPQGVVVDGFGVSSLGTTVVGQYQPPWVPYPMPLQLGDGGVQNFSYSYRIIFLNVTVTELRVWNVVAEGTVRVPGVDYDMPCLVLHEFVTASDSLGTTNENYHLYSWITPGGFAGANGVVALQSDNNAAASFTQCRSSFVMGTNNLAPTAATPSLAVDTHDVSFANGGTVNFSLDAGPAHAGKAYQLLGGISGASPGTPLSGGGTLAVTYDPIAAQVLALSNTPNFVGFAGTLDAAGQATATLNVPTPLPAMLAGAHLDFAFTTVNPFDFQSHSTWLQVGP